MKIHFHKYQGTGNDFILIDDRNRSFPVNKKLVQKLCNQKFGVGADGLILIQPHDNLDYKMVYFNSDGSQSLCGNGSRCAFAFARSLEMVGSSATFETTDGVHKIKYEDDLIHFQLFDTPKPEQLSENDWYLNTGSPHFIQIVHDVVSTEVVKKGREIRNSDEYIGQNGTNVNFAQLLPEHIKIRTYERGVENETLSCGTGATAVGLLAGLLGYQSPVRIETEGGNLFVHFKNEDDGYREIWLAGPAELVFEGSVTI